MPLEYPTVAPKRVGHLRPTRDQLAQTIRYLENRLAKSRVRLAEVEQQLAVAEIAVRRVSARGRNPYFRRGELIGSCLEALRCARAMRSAMRA